MLGAAGMIIPEILAAGGLIPQTSDEVAWFKTGVIPPAGNYGRFWCDPYALFFIEVIAFQFAELRRWQDYKKPGSMGKQYFLGFEKVLGGSGNPSYPGKQSSLIWHVLSCPFDMLHVYVCIFETASSGLYMCICNEVGNFLTACAHVKMLASTNMFSVMKLRTL